MVDEFCVGCKFLGVLTRWPYCAFNDVTGHSRGCRSGTGCDRRTEGKKAHSPNYYAFFREHEESAPSEIKKEQISWPSRSILESSTGSRKSRAAKKNRALAQGKQRNAILEYKAKNNLTSKELADLIGISVSTFNKWTTEYAPANWEKLAKLGIKKPF